MATIVISPYRATKYLDRAGNFWVYLQYALGLQAVGSDVWWLERLERPGEGSRAGIDAPPAEQASLLSDALARFGISNAPILYTTEGEDAEHFEPTYVGIGARQAESVFRRADALLNFHQRIHPELLARFQRTALVDIDPGLLQYWMSSGQLQIPDHDVYLTIGETVGTPAAGFPDCGRAWVHIRPPVFLNQWPFTPHRAPAPFTTVSSWYSSEYILEGDGYWDNNKRASWLSFAELPRLTDQPLELATYFGSKDASERQLLETHGWRVRHAGDVANTPERYRSYIQSSRGEFSCAKPSCSRFQNAWISDRTLCYLASGKPAVVQDTGPSSVPDGGGLHRFSTIEEAAAAIAEVNASYNQNCRAARDIAETYFDATRVASRIVETVLGAKARRPRDRA
ncbi:MAG: hypothetical protein AABM42_07585 [Actinomycetota bacterium]